MNREQAIELFNKLVIAKSPFLFVINYKADDIYIKKLADIDSNKVKYSIGNISNAGGDRVKEKNYYLKKYPMTFEQYKKSFDMVIDNIRLGNSYLTNLTCKTPIDTNLSLADIFYFSRAPYKLYFKDRFTVFSPEIFVKIKDGIIFSYPMKGTIDASIPNAENIILKSRKEAAEHATIVDLIRNDLSRIAVDVKVCRYRYIDKINTSGGELLQVSSEVRGRIISNHGLGEVFFELLPAGSICGAPKPSTLKIISEAEGYDRGFYTGVFGVFDGESIDSAVSIRYIEKEEGRLYFKSGGGITSESICTEEYNEMKRKIYLAF